MRCKQTLTSFFALSEILRYFAQCPFKSRWYTFYFKPFLKTTFLQNLLRHPLCLALIRRKWQNYGRYLYFTGLFFYLIFLALFTSYALLTPNANSDSSNSSYFCRDPAKMGLVTEISEKSLFFIVCQFGIIAFVIFNCLMEVVQFYRVIIFSRAKIRLKF